MKCANNPEFENMGLKTVNQWLKEKKIPIEDAEGLLLWCNRYCQRTAVYYEPSQVRDMTEEELAPYREENRQKRLERKERLKERHKQRLKDEYEFGYDTALLKCEKLICNVREVIKKAFSEIFKPNAESIIADASKKIVFDIETTGLSAYDEILQISVIDGEGSVLINSYVKPYTFLEWKDAERINNISPEMIKDAPYLHELVTDLQRIFYSAKTWIAYNGNFDLSFLKCIGIRPNEDTIIEDVMFDFAEFYGEWNDYFQSFKWQKLGNCASYFGYEFNAHDSLEDVKATLYCYNKLNELKATGEYQKRVDLNYQSVE